MTSRAEQLRAHHRRVLAWSLGAAAVVHVAVFAITPAFRAKPLGGSDVPLEPGHPVGANATVDVHFGPPLVLLPDGEAWQEPPDRVLEAQRDVALPPGCTGLAEPGRTPLRGRVALRVRPSGLVDVVGLPGQTGDPCADQVAKTVAGALRYHWLPNDRFAAPVELVQPITLVAVRE
jgi:hypothetical protein